MSKPLIRSVGIRPSFRKEKQEARSRKQGAFPLPASRFPLLLWIIAQTASRLRTRCNCGTMPRGRRYEEERPPADVGSSDVLHARRRSYMDATAVVTTALTIDMNNFIKG